MITKIWDSFDLIKCSLLGHFIKYKPGFFDTQARRGQKREYGEGKLKACCGGKEKNQAAEGKQEEVKEQAEGKEGEEEEEEEKRRRWRNWFGGFTDRLRADCG